MDPHTWSLEDILWDPRSMVRAPLQRLGRHAPAGSTRAEGVAGRPQPAGASATRRQSRGRRQRAPASASKRARVAGDLTRGSRHRWRCLAAPWRRQTRNFSLRCTGRQRSRRGPLLPCGAAAGEPHHVGNRQNGSRRRSARRVAARRRRPRTTLYCGCCFCAHPVPALRLCAAAGAAVRQSAGPRETAAVQHTLPVCAS